MFVSINKQLIIFMTASELYLGFGRDRVRRLFLISKVSTGKIKVS
jgi:hypothetical protein